MSRPSCRTALTLLLAVSLAAAPAPAKPKPAAPLAGIDAYVARAMKEFGVPGMAVAVVKDGQVVLAKGYGVRRAGAPEPVDADTLFGIASNTKAFTCAALSILVQDGKLSWDDPVTKHLPAFQMYDPWVTREVTVRDLVTHPARNGPHHHEHERSWRQRSGAAPRGRGRRPAYPRDELRQR
jgi:CubicO group peptidase (beta-lactamase class C family)